MDKYRMICNLQIHQNAVRALAFESSVPTKSGCVNKSIHDPAGYAARIKRTIRSWLATRSVPLLGTALTQSNLRGN
jgi:hypothetical protein